MAEEPMTVTLTEPAIAGTYEVERLEGGDLLLRRPLTSLADIEHRYGLRPLTTEEFERYFGDLPRDGEG